MQARSAPAALRPAVVAGLVALLCLLWGSTWWAIRICLVDQPPLWSAGLRFVLAGLALAALSAALRGRDPAPPPPAWLWLAAGATCFAGSYGILYIAEQTVPSGLAAVLWSVFPLLMAISGITVLGERLQLLQLAGFVVSFLGIVIVFQGTGDEPDSAPLADCLFLLLSPMVSAIGTTLIKKYGATSSSLQLNRNGMLCGAVLLLAAAAWREPAAALHWTPAGVGALLYLGLAGTALTFGVYFWLLQRVPASPTVADLVCDPGAGGAARGAGRRRPHRAVAVARHAGRVRGRGPGHLEAAAVTRRRRFSLRLRGRRNRGRAAMAAVVFVLLAVVYWRCAGSDRRYWPHTDILTAIRFVESGHRDNPPDGDAGLAIGPYQIHEVYWRDAVRAEPSLGGSYQDCRQRRYAERVIAAYMQHYAAAAWEQGEAETIARVHNGGPLGGDKAATRGYWRKVRAALP